MQIKILLIHCIYTFDRNKNVEKGFVFGSILLHCLLLSISCWKQVATLLFSSCYRFSIMTTFIYVGSLILHILTIFLQGKNVFKYTSRKHYRFKWRLNHFQVSSVVKFGFIFLFSWVNCWSPSLYDPIPAYVNIFLLRFSRRYLQQLEHSWFGYSKEERHDNERGQASSSNKG